MSCERAKAFSHLRVVSRIDAKKCRIKAGTEVEHEVAVENLGPVDTCVSIVSKCAERGGLAYGTEKKWDPDEVKLDGYELGGGGQTAFPFESKLGASAGVHGPEQLFLSVCRRRPTASRLTRFPSIGIRVEIT